MSDDLSRRLRNLRESYESGDIDLAAYNAGVERLRTTYGADAVAQQHGTTSDRISVNFSTDSGSIANSPMSMSVVSHADQVTFPPAPDRALAREQQALLAYLRYVMGECTALPLGKIDRTDADRARPVELARVYVSLNTTEQVPLTDDEIAALLRGRRQQFHEGQRPSRPVSALEAVSQRLMLLGAPGSGKSTFVSHLSLCLAGAMVSQRRPNEAAPDGGWLARLPGWQHGALIPVRVILRDLAAFPPLAQSTRGSVRLLEQFLAAMLDEAGCADALQPLTAALHDGSALLLLDGLDEVVGDAVLRRVNECIGVASRTYRVPILVTCRILDYQEEPLRQLATFPASTLAELNADQIQQFVRDWYDGLTASGRRTLEQAAERAQALQSAIGERSELRELAGSPLLLTVMALVHAFKGRLPDSRAQLYAECIDLLLLRWRQPDDGPDLLRQIGLDDLRESDLRAMMARLGFVAHQKAERAPDEPTPADLTEDEVIGVLADEFARYDPQRKRARAEIVFHALARGNGLLLQRGPSTYAFPHRTFQEFLAGQYIKGQQRTYMQLSKDRAAHPHWHEALSLMASFQVLEEGEIERPLLLADQLLERSVQEQVLAGEILAMIGRERAAGRYSEEETRRIWPKAIGVLRKLSTTGKAPDAPATLRVRAGLALGHLCYGSVEAFSRTVAATFFPDPRLPFAMIGTPFQKHPNWPRSLEHYWCSIEPGPFWSGDDRTEQLQPAAIDTPYQIARYPVTNADYARFLTANGPDGYDPSKPWWTEEGRTYISKREYMYPRYWTAARFNNPLQPVVELIWYEAAAYCRWLTGEGHAVGWLSNDQEIRLPSWYEWERAARHTDTRSYPWGTAQPDPERANYADTGLGVSAPVGCFCTGAAVCGAQDMVGNVSEWSASPWKKWDQMQKDFTRFDEITFKWNAFSGSTDELKCGARVRNNPDGRYFDQGFRLVLSPSRSV